MNMDVIMGRWQQLSASAWAMLGKLVDDERVSTWALATNRSGKMQEAFGLARMRATRKINHLQRELGRI